MILERTEKATPWRERTIPLRPLVNREGVVPVRTQLSAHDLDFLEVAREEMLCFAELGLRLLDLHRPRDAGGITSDAANPIMRCRSCMWRWPCPTFRAVAETLDSPWWDRRAQPIDRPQAAQQADPGEHPRRDSGDGPDPGDMLSIGAPA
ncbi:hypothetical protein [Spongiactinospora sp. TRM90649]|uniref:hypothetical protein n=1 Tax=Spongiactinospora sp. TRM90649 TaxID=3031114 RepID=UPI0023F7052F|nr:hypothetical protein [Spongiactinospora sp. TRM90649]MDF5752999.1 hypothetical protein [Spongiactinospora sp. TRM90649]